MTSNWKLAIRAGDSWSVAEKANEPIDVTSISKSQVPLRGLLHHRGDPKRNSLQLKDFVLSPDSVMEVVPSVKDAETVCQVRQAITSRYTYAK
ncbi:MAG: hypothetical protein EAX81_01030 [Candidatus Thorarchaeota archaeon]|nr:hypothetical protein [Candidatus Thorarchaeota archaeon]